ncbi:MAG: elongation factor 1-beta [Candidatus Pacearchaeota archaeon]
MGYVIVKIKIMPVSVETDIEKIKKRVVQILKKNGNNNHKFEIQPIAFGLKALILLFSWPEEKSLDHFENELKDIQGVSSIEILDMRREIG